MPPPDCEASDTTSQSHSWPCPAITWRCETEDAGLDESVANGARDGRGDAVDLELAVDALHVAADGVEAELEIERDALVGSSAHEPAQDVLLALGEIEPRGGADAVAGAEAP